MLATHKIRTSLTTEQCAQAFNDAGRTPMFGDHGLRKMLSKVAPKPDFFTPDATEASDADRDPPELCLGCQFHLPGNEHITMHMYVWDRGDIREGELVVPDAAGKNGTERFISKFTDMLRVHDPALEVR